MPALITQRVPPLEKGPVMLAPSPRHTDRHQRRTGVGRLMARRWQADHNPSSIALPKLA